LPFWFDARLRRAVSDFNLARNFVISGTWELPNPRLDGAAGWAFRGWEFGGILEASSGAPFTVIVGGDPLGLNSQDPWDYPDRLGGSGCSSLVNSGNPTNYIKTQCFTPANPINRLGNNGRNALTGPGLLNTDFSFNKNNRLPWLRENANLQFRAELFNIFNRPNFAAPNENNVLFSPAPNPAFNPNLPNSLANNPNIFPAVASAGQIVRTQTFSRQIQFGLKLTF
jgi:hypothetical protein